MHHAGIFNWFNEKKTENGRQLKEKRSINGNNLVITKQRHRQDRKSTEIQR